MAPRFQHDCVNCIYLGQFKEFDLYFHQAPVGRPTVLARYGDEGHEYKSGLSFGRPQENGSVLIEELGVAYQRAFDIGFLRGDERD